MGCKRCGRCCSVLYVHFSGVGFDEKWVEGRGGEIRGMDVYLPCRCKWLTEGNLCEIYGDRPRLCREFPGDFLDKVALKNMGCRYFE
jgi:Fe-S-cluster containining protein